MCRVLPNFLLKLARLAKDFITLWESMLWFVKCSIMKGSCYHVSVVYISLETDMNEHVTEV